VSKRHWHRITANTRARFAFLLERLAQADPDDAPLVDQILERMDPQRIDEIAAVLLAALKAEIADPPEAYFRKLRAWAAALAAGLRAVRRARSILRLQGGAFIYVALAEVEQDLRGLIQESPFVAAARRYHPKIGRPNKDPRMVAQLQGYGVSRDDARELLRAVRIAAQFSWPNPPPSGPAIRFTPPSLLELAEQRAAAAKK
jgi:hypothetical protein